MIGPSVMLILVGIFTALGGFFSGSETGVYRLSRFKLRLGREHNKPFYALLDKLMQDSQAVVFSILIGNNLVNYLATSIVTLLLLKATGRENLAQTYTTLIMTPVLFIFSEVVPKNIYYYRSDVLMPALAPLLFIFHKIFQVTGMVYVLKAFSGLASRALGSYAGPPTEVIRTRRHRQIMEFLHESREEGILSSVQNDIMSRLVNVPSIPVVSVMLPIQSAVKVEVGANRQELLNTLKIHDFTRLLVYERSPGNLLGFIDIYQVLGRQREFESLREFVRPVSRLSSNTSVIEAIHSMIKHRDKVVFVTAEAAGREQILGLVTMKDLVEELTGELAQW